MSTNSTVTVRLSSGTGQHGDGTRDVAAANIGMAFHLPFPG
ncbi:hypothetical protein [Micromonospora avicenniae]